MPSEMYKAFDQGLHAMLYGDFEACFFKEKFDDEDVVCIEDVKNLRVELPKFD